MIRYTPDVAEWTCNCMLTKSINDAGEGMGVVLND